MLKNKILLSVIKISMSHITTFIGKTSPVLKILCRQGIKPSSPTPSQTFVLTVTRRCLLPLFVCILIVFSVFFFFFFSLFLGKTGGHMHKKSCHRHLVVLASYLCCVVFEPRHEKTGLRRLKPDKTQTGLLS